MEERLKVLVVDDDDIDRMAVRRSLKASGIDADVTEATDAAGALEQVRASRFDCGLFDFRMPGSDGLEQIELPRKIGVKRFFADPQLHRKIIHGHTAEAVTEEVPPGSIVDTLPVNIVLSPLRP